MLDLTTVQKTLNKAVQMALEGRRLKTANVYPKVYLSESNHSISYGKCFLITLPKIY